MSLRSFEQEDSIASVAIERPTLTKAAGTFESVHDFVAVSGMSALPAVVQHMTSAQTMKVLGRVETQGHRFDVDNDHLPSGSVLKVGDHVIVASGLYQGTYEIAEATLIQGREWNCVMLLKPESKTS